VSCVEAPRDGHGSRGADAASSVCLIVLDGWGVAEPGPGNAIALAHTPVFDRLWSGCPHATLEASGPSVGLPEGQMGNSEVGHLTLGAGAVVPQPLTRINEAIARGELALNDVLCTALSASRRVHLLGLTSDGGVHSELGHLRALIELASRVGTAELVLHCITDGRDSSPTAGERYLQTIEGWCEQAGIARIASVIGRYYAMDRDRRWERTQAAYDLLVHGSAAHHASDAVTAARDAYARGETDEFITATTVGADGRVGVADSVLCFNFRPDRMRQLVRALADPELEAGSGELPGWNGRAGAAPIEQVATMTPYQEGWSFPAAFPPERPRATLAGAVAAAGARQLHVAETEKYAHVTYFFNGGVERPLAGEARILVPSRRDVPTYDRKPQMSAREITDALLRAFTESTPRLTVLNFANADMVGHTGVLDATVIAVETIDECLGRVIAAVERAGGVCVITADHGNAEQMLTTAGGPDTAHSSNPVPLIVAGPRLGSAARLAFAGTGTLTDVAPTVLELLGIAPAPEMSGRSLLMRELVSHLRP
jgi:2,3-bisphosphoglycerate-independent phosphoglycerate mutase